MSLQERDPPLILAAICEQRLRVKRILQVGLALLLAGTMWYYAAAILVPHQEKEATMQHIPRGNLSDLYPRWLGARELLLHGRDPYSADVTREIQIGYYGEALDSARPDLPKDEQRFAYPVYVVFLLAPTIKLPFPILRMWFRLLLLVLTAASAPLWIRGLGLRVNRTDLATIAVLLLGSFPVVQGLYLDQLTLLVCFLLAAACATIARGNPVLAGILLAVATIKPQVALPVTAWFGLWAFSDWKRRRGVFWGFVSTMSAFLAAAHWVLPGWFGRWWTAIHAYIDYSAAQSLLGILFGRRGGLMMTVVIVLAVSAICWLRRREPVGSLSFNVCLLSVLAADILVKPKFPLYDGILLLPLLVWLWTNWKTIKNSPSLPSRLLCWITAFLAGGQWLGAVALTVVSLFYSAAIAQNGWKLPLATLFFLPLSSACLLGLLALDVWRIRAVSLVALPGTAWPSRGSTDKPSPLGSLAAHSGSSQ